ncbi:MAG: cytochrome c peroxidase [Alcanivoracaceae bacterium]|nr:cytochrome c peroxidase [Alcanivoracaceae bacterium]
MLTYTRHGLPALAALALLSGCGGDNSSPVVIDNPADLDDQLMALIAEHNLTGAPEAGRNLPDVNDPLAQLGMRLFFSKSLGGGFDSACASCHHPLLGGADGLSLPIGTGADDPDVLGLARSHPDGVPNVPRHSPTVFNAGLWDTALFWDSRVESLGGEAGANGAASGIRTPDSALFVADAEAGNTLPQAQARFPVLEDTEMKTANFENGSDASSVRAHLAARLGDYGVGAGEIADNNWLTHFQTAFASGADAETLITFDNITAAIAAYERSMVFTDTPWRDYIGGDAAAISDSAKRGAILFLTPAEENGANCIACHSGDLFSDEQAHIVAFPQFGPGKGDGATGDDDFGRERETGDARDRYRLRTPSLLNVALTAPYGHTGAYRNLTEVVRHYANPGASVNGFFGRGGWCSLPQIQGIGDCASRYPNARANSQLALATLADEQAAGRAVLRPVPLNPDEVADLVSFLEALTDRCAADPACVSTWVPAPSGAADTHQLNATF